MPSFFGLIRLSAGDVFFRRKKEQPSNASQQKQQQQTKWKQSLSMSDVPLRTSIDYHSRVYDHDLATKFGDNVMVNDLELLLSMETQARMEAIEARERRSRKLRFSLPPPPLRPIDPYPPSPPQEQQQQQQSSSGRWSRWRRRSSDSGGSMVHRNSDVSASSSQMSLSNQEEQKFPPDIGLSSRVQLIRRPLPTYGTVRFIGTVDFAPGAEWFGVELDSRVGKNDGSVKAIRYFDTDRDRGIFVLRDDLTLIVEDDNSTSESDG